MTPTVENIMSVFNHASLTAYRDGLTWYDDAHDFALSLDSNVERAAGIIAAFSPLNGWSNNKRCAAAIYAGVTTGLGLRGSEIKAVRILNGESPLDVLGGDKVRSFYSTILDPRSPEAAPVIDRHAQDIALGFRQDNKARKAPSGKRYQHYVELYRRCAETVNIAPPQLQAITWLTWRERHGVSWHG